MNRKIQVPKSLSWLAFYIYCFLIGIILASLKAPFWVIAVLFLGVAIVHSLALSETPGDDDG